MRILTTIFAMVGLTLTTAACTNDRPRLSNTDTTSEFQREYNEFKRAMDRKLETVENRIDTLRVKAAEGSENVKTTMTSKIDALETKRKSLENEINELVDAGADRFAEVRLKIEDKYKKLESEVRQISY